MAFNPLVVVDHIVELQKSKLPGSTLKEAERDAASKQLYEFLVELGYE